VESGGKLIKICFACTKKLELCAGSNVPDKIQEMAVKKWSNKAPICLDCELLYQVSSDYLKSIIATILCLLGIYLLISDT
jgi:hypothetical protein